MSYAPIPNEKTESCTRRIQLEDLNPIIVLKKESIQKRIQQEKEDTKTTLLKKFIEILQYKYLMDCIVDMNATDKRMFTIIVDYTKEESESFGKLTVDDIIYRNLDEILTKGINKENFNGIDWNKSIYGNLCDMLPEEFTVYSATYSHELNYTEFIVYTYNSECPNMYGYILCCCNPMYEHH